MNEYIYITAKIQNNLNPVFDSHEIRYDVHCQVIGDFVDKFIILFRNQRVSVQSISIRPSVMRNSVGVKTVSLLLALLGVLFAPIVECRHTNLRRSLLQDVNALPNPMDDNGASTSGYSLKGGLSWWDKFYIPAKNGGKSKVPMPDGLKIARKSTLSVEKGNHYVLEPINAPVADNKKVGTFKAGSDNDYMAMAGGMPSASAGGSGADPGNEPKGGDPSKPAAGDMTKEATLINGGKEIDPPGINGEPLDNEPTSPTQAKREEE